MNSDWTQNEKLKQIDPAKLSLLSQLADSGSGKNQQELYSFLLSAASESKTRQLTFTKEEIATIVEVVKQGKSKDQQTRINKIIQLMNLMGYKKR